MYIYLENDLANFHPDPIWNGRAFGFFEEVTSRRTSWVAIWDQFVIWKWISLVVLSKVLRLCMLQYLFVACGLVHVDRAVSILCYSICVVIYRLNALYLCYSGVYSAQPNVPPHRVNRNAESSHIAVKCRRRPRSSDVFDFQTTSSLHSDGRYTSTCMLYCTFVCRCGGTLS